MMVSELERKLKHVDPKFAIRYRHSMNGTFGDNIAGIFYGNQYLVRISQGEITLLARREKKVSVPAVYDDEGKEVMEAQYRFIKHRGLYDLLALLRSLGKLNRDQSSYITNPNT